MFGWKKKHRDVMGHTISAPRPTLWAYLYILKYVAAPLLLILLALDILLFFIFKYAFDSCYGLACLL